MMSIIDQIEVDYARFNAVKTFTTNEPSVFEQTQFGDLIATRDRARQDSYYNRVLGITAANIAVLDEAIDWILADAKPHQRVRIDVARSNDARSDLNERFVASGFELVDSLIWLHGDPGTMTSSQGNTSTPRLLSRGFWPDLRALLSAHGDIPDEIWREKRTHLCTDSFRWFGIFNHDNLVSAASSWATTDAVVLGSAYTRPRWRRRGHQQQLLNARIGLAETPIYVDVAPGSTSHRNCTRAGFRDLEHRQIWEYRPPTPRGI